MRGPSPPHVQAIPSERAVLPIVAANVSASRCGRMLLDDISLTIGKAAGITMLMGPNGAGKSLLARCLANLVDPDHGRLTWAGIAPDRARQRGIGFVFQKPVLFNRSVISNVTFAVEAAGFSRLEADDRARAALANCGLAHLAHQAAPTLSGGERQRLALARALACEPQIVILDEPCANLDPHSAAAIENEIKKAREAGASVLLISHDLAQARRLGQRLVFMHQGRIFEDGPAADILLRPRSREARQFFNGELVT